MTAPKPRAEFHDFQGPDGNIFAIIGGCHKALREQGTPEQLAAFEAALSAAMQAGSGVGYHAMIALCEQYVIIVPEPPRAPTKELQP